MQERLQSALTLYIDLFHSNTYQLCFAKIISKHQRTYLSIGIVGIIQYSI